MKKIIVWIIYSCFFSIKLIYANDLPLSLAFQSSVEQLNNKLIVVHLKMANGYHLYKNKIQIYTDNDKHQAQIGMQILPPALILNSSILGDLEVYEDKVDVLLPIISYGNNNLALNIYYQGCKGLDMCFPEIHEIKSLVLNPNFKMSKPNYQAESISLRTFLSSFNGNETVDFFKHNIWFVYLGFFLVGILISFTPCVFPMFPILFTLIINKHPTTRRAFILSGCYVLGSASAYAISGIIAAESGYVLQTILQNIWVKGLTVFLFVLFGISLFGVFNIQMPQILRNKFSQIKIPQSRLGLFIVGGISALILSPCITPALAGGLIYIASTGNVILGGSALFVLGIGSGIPLLIMSVFGNKILPHTGRWMIVIKSLLGFLMLAMAIYLLSSIINKLWILGLISIWLISLGIFLFWGGIYTKTKFDLLLKIIGILIVIVSLIYGGKAIKLLFDYQHQKQLMAIESDFLSVDNLTKLNKVLLEAKLQHKPVIVDFFAKWCVACIEMDETTLIDPEIIHMLKNYVFVKADLTLNNQDSKILQKQFNVLAPPTLIFIKSDGSINSKCMIVGYVKHEEFAKLLHSCE